MLSERSWSTGRIAAIKTTIRGGGSGDLYRLLANVESRLLQGQIRHVKVVAKELAFDKLAEREG
jgi:hypothetical protein